MSSVSAISCSLYPPNNASARPGPNEALLAPIPPVPHSPLRPSRCRRRRRPRSSRQCQAQPIATALLGNALAGGIDDHRTHHLGRIGEECVPVLGAKLAGTHEAQMLSCTKQVVSSMTSRAPGELRPRQAVQVGVGRGEQRIPRAGIAGLHPSQKFGEWGQSALPAIPPRYRFYPAHALRNILPADVGSDAATGSVWMKRREAPISQHEQAGNRDINRSASSFRHHRRSP